MSDSAPTQRTKRPPIWVIVLVIITVAVLGLIPYYFLRPLDAPIPNDAGALTAGLERGFTAEGYPRLGSADAPVLIEDFSSYACPHCREFHEDLFPRLINAIAAGEVQFVMIPVPHIGGGADNAAKAAFCAGEQDRFWEMHDVLFDWQDRFTIRTFDTRRLKKGAEALELDRAQFEACLDSSAVQAKIDTAERDFWQRDLTGTPSFFFNGEKVRDYAEFDVFLDT